ncbi:antichymotrypsin-1-like isoform X2 [Epargyreus clarus]
MKSWLSSPLITNYLLSLYQNGAPFQKKYVQIYNSVKVTQPCKFRNKLFLPSSHNVEKYLKTSDIGVENVPFENNNDASKIINNWINEYGTFKEGDLNKYVLPNTACLLVNASEFKGVWKSDQVNPVMNVHNSFSYTEDIKYEARLLELPMEDDFRLVVVVPNEVDSLHTLYKTLTTKGLDAAITCVQPLFTHTTVLEAPSIEFSSEGEVVSEA